MQIQNPSATPPTYECLYVEAARQALDPDLLLAVLRQERGKMGTFSYNPKSNTWDIGPWQINSSWLRKLSRMTNRSELDVASALAFDGCWNLATGAWVLRSAINEARGNIWLGVSKYNSPNPANGHPYAQMVYKHYLSIKQSSDKKGDVKVQNSGSYSAPVLPVTTIRSPHTNKQIYSSAKPGRTAKTAGPVNRVWFIEAPSTSDMTSIAQPTAQGD